MEFVTSISKRSTCKRLHVGAIITDSECNEIITYGYNGNYAGGPNECDTNEPGYCGCIHAEENALIKTFSDKAHTIFITDSPCEKCAKLIINSGIKRVYYQNEYRIKDGINLLKKSKIKVTKLWKS